ncbi:hypothetical protein D3C75_993230 [compost metagenome]
MVKVTTQRIAYWSEPSPDVMSRGVSEYSGEILNGARKSQNRAERLRISNFAALDWALAPIKSNCTIASWSASSVSVPSSVVSGSNSNSVALVPRRLELISVITAYSSGGVDVRFGQARRIRSCGSAVKFRTRSFMAPRTSIMGTPHRPARSSAGCPAHRPTPPPNNPQAQR